MAINIKKLVTLPLFMGLTELELRDIAKTTALGQRYQKKGTNIITEGDDLDSLYIVISGWFEACTTSDNKKYQMVEFLSGPYVIEPDKLFGIQKQTRSTYRTVTACELLCISKDALMSLFDKYLIARLNFLNLVCRNAQLGEKTPWMPKSTGTKGSIVDFIKQHCRIQAGKKTLYTKMVDLADEVNDSRQMVSDALHELEEEEKIIVQRGIITIPALQLL